MENEYLQDIVIELHQESLHWLSVLDLWKFETNFFKMLLEKAALASEADSEKLGEFQEKVERYGRQFQEMSKSITEHEKSLKAFSQGDKSFDRYHYREEHESIRVNVKKLFAEIKELKQELFQFVEKLI